MITCWWQENNDRKRNSKVKKNEVPEIRDLKKKSGRDRGRGAEHQGEWGGAQVLINSVISCIVIAAINGIVTIVIHQHCSNHANFIVVVVFIVVITVELCLLPANPDDGPHNFWSGGQLKRSTSTATTKTTVGLAATETTAGLATTGPTVGLATTRTTAGLATTLDSVDLLALPFEQRRVTKKREREILFLRIATNTSTTIDTSVLYLILGLLTHQKTCYFHKFLWSWDVNSKLFLDK